MPGSESTCSTELQRAISRFHESPPEHWVGGEGGQLGSHCTEIGGDLTGRSPRPEVGAGHGRLARIGPGRLALVDDVRPACTPIFWAARTTWRSRPALPAVAVARRHPPPGWC